MHTPNKLLFVFLLIYFECNATGAKERANKKERVVEPQTNSSSDYDFEDVLSRHKRQCACLSQYTPVNCKCQQADPSNSNDLSCRCDRATVSPQCSCAPAASTLCFPVCQQQCIQSCVAQQQSVPQCQPPCQLICQRACQSLPAAPVYATLQPLQIAGQPAPPAPLSPLPVEPNGRVIYAIPQAPTPHPPPPPAPNAQSIGQATVYLPTQAQCIPLCTEQCMKNCPNSPGQCAQTCTAGCQAACSRQPLQVNQPGPPLPIALPQNDPQQGCVALCRPDCSPKCTRQFVEPSSSSLVLAQVGNRDTAANKHRAPVEYTLQADNDFELPPNTHTIFESEYFIPLNGRSNNIVIPIPLPNQPQLEINLSQGPAYATVPKQGGESSDNKTKMYEVPTQAPPATTEQTPEPSTQSPPNDPSTSNNDNRLRAALTASGLPPLQLPGYPPFQQGLQPFQTPNPALQPFQAPNPPLQTLQQQPSYTPTQIAAYYQQLLAQLGGLQQLLNHAANGQQNNLGQQSSSNLQNPDLSGLQNMGYNGNNLQSLGQSPTNFQNSGQNLFGLQGSGPSPDRPSPVYPPSVGQQSSNFQSPDRQNPLTQNYVSERPTNPPSNHQQNLPNLLQSDQQPPNYPSSNQPTSNWPSPLPSQQQKQEQEKPQKEQTKIADSQQIPQNTQTSQRLSPPQSFLPSPTLNDKIVPPSVLFPAQATPPPGFLLSNSYLPQGPQQLFVSPYFNGQLQAYQQAQQHPSLPSHSKSHPPTKFYSPRRPDAVPTKLFSPPANPTNDGELRLDIQWPGQAPTDPANCTGPGVQCVQQYNKGFRVTASEAQSFFKRRFSKIKASASLKRKELVTEFDDNGRANRIDPKAVDYTASKLKDAGTTDNELQQRRPVGGSGRVQRTEREECQDSCRKVCSRACEKHRLSANDYKCSRRCVDECGQRCPAFKRM